MSNNSHHPKSPTSQRVQKVGTVTVIVPDPNDVNKVAHRIHAFVRTVDRHGVVNVFVNGESYKPEAAPAAKPAKARGKKAEASMLD